MENNDYHPLFETKLAKGRILFRLHAVSIFVAICMIFVYRVSYFPGSFEGKVVERLAWSGVFLAELWFSWYWFVTLVNRWNPIYRYPFKERLSLRYEKELPGIDIFVCTADPVIEPPSMVINTVLSVMAYDYPPEKLSVYLSDDGGSDLMFYALLEASRFSKKWVPFCKKFKVEPRSPEAYFWTAVEALEIDDPILSKEWLSMKKLYEDMKERIVRATKLGRVSEDIRKQHKGFREWDFVTSPRHHQTILQILIDGRDGKDVDTDGQSLPTLVYLAREKRPQYHHNFKAGAMNALIRVSSKISNGPIILNVDCDMYSNNSEVVRDALCFFMDEKESHNIAYVQYPQNFSNLTKNDVYSSSLMVINEVELHGLDSNGGPCYIGTGCFHRRDVLCGKKYSKEYKTEYWIKRVNTGRQFQETPAALEETCKVLASCTYEDNTLWGKEMGLMYGCPVEDIISGLTIQCRGWRSIYHNPERKGFLGLAPTTLLQSLVQHKRWSEGDFQIFLSSYCPFLYGRGNIPPQLQLAYCPYLLWAANSLATLYYVSVPSLCLLGGSSLFPKISSPWALAFLYAILANRAYSLGEFLWTGGTLKGWWNDQRMWMYKRTTSYFFGFAENILKLLGFTRSAFVITAKVAEEDVYKRFEQEIMEFGTSSPMFTILAALALLNQFSFVWGLKREMLDVQNRALDEFALQILLSGVVLLINIPVYQGLFFRNDNGRMPTSVTYCSVFIALLVSTIAAY